MVVGHANSAMKRGIPALVLVLLVTLAHAEADSLVKEALELR